MNYNEILYIYISMINPPWNYVATIDSSVFRRRMGTHVRGHSDDNFCMLAVQIPRLRQKRRAGDMYVWHPLG